MNVDKLTNIAGITGFVGFVLDGAIQSNLINPAIAPLVKGSQGFALALIAWYVGKPASVRAR